MQRKGVERAVREEVLARFFKGRATPAELARDLKGSEQRVSDIQSIVEIEDMQEEFVVTRGMAVALCDAVLSEQLEPSALATIGFALMASDKFSWDGEDVLGEIIADWSCPEINFTLNMENVRQFRAWLIEQEPYPVRPSVAAGSPKIISVRRKKNPQR
jgi:hypothetical protein